MYAYIFELYNFYTVSSPYLLVFGDNRVMPYTGAYDVVDGTSEQWRILTKNVGGAKVI